ncbi:LOW QUALITY PROTEIN: probable small intestine urate exporter [Perognathus longimembris pacificus]|uniref:LOW QUALITY PROTEIN: probable small intestine urate exporter n=1 Tax=Perognathus longimembris pacificus TaxID=214514 RepID=UPI002019EBA0|nr:LOW QUALITY PROTEIN: probable small intestine urate exporter [Perognathus longimembris pacificus]
MSLSIAITAMVNNTATSSNPNASIEKPPTDYYQDYWNERVKEFKAVAPTYDWSPEIQGIILSSLSYGSFLAPIPTGYVAGIFGAKYVVGAGLFISSVLTLFLPLGADAGVAPFIVLRVMQGIAQVMVSTGQFSIWVKWACPTEISQLTTIAGSGILLGNSIVLIAGGFLCQAIGWPYVFYIFGGIGCACCLLWFSLVYNEPRNHPFISSSEKSYILRAVAQQDHLPDWSLPIKDMVKSLPLWAIVVSYFCLFWQFSTMMAYTPTYYNSVFQVNVRDNGILSALPSISSYFCVILGGLLAAFLSSRKILRPITIRKLFTAIGVLSSTVVLLILPWTKSSFSTTLALFVLCSSFSSLCNSGAIYEGCFHVEKRIRVKFRNKETTQTKHKPLICLCINHVEKFLQVTPLKGSRSSTGSYKSVVQFIQAFIRVNTIPSSPRDKA